DLADLAGAAAASGVTRADRLREHVRLMRDRGPVWLGLAGDAGSTELLGLLVGGEGDREGGDAGAGGGIGDGAGRGGGGDGRGDDGDGAGRTVTPGVTALTWWDRLAPDQGA